MTDDDVLRVDSTRDGGRVMVRLEGELDAGSVGRLWRCVEPVARAPRLVLDVSDITFIDSSGLRAIVAIARQRRACGQDVEISNPSRPVARLFEVVGVGRVPGLRVAAGSAHG